MIDSDMPTLGDLAEAAELLGWQPDDPHEIKDVPKWALPSVVGNLNANTLGCSLLHLARYADPAAGVDERDLLLYRTAQWALYLGRGIAPDVSPEIATYIGIPPMAGHIAARAIAASADEYLRPAVKELNVTLWPYMGRAHSPGKASLTAALHLHREATRFGLAEQVGVRQLIGVGQSDSNTYGPAIRNLLRVVCAAASQPVGWEFRDRLGAVLADFVHP